jgi:hypothetical protein
VVLGGICNGSVLFSPFLLINVSIQNRFCLRRSARDKFSRRAKVPKKNEYFFLNSLKFGFSIF